ERRGPLDDSLLQIGEEDDQGGRVQGCVGHGWVSFSRASASVISSWIWRELRRDSATMKAPPARRRKVPPMARAAGNRAGQPAPGRWSGRERLVAMKTTTAA